MSTTEPTTKPKEEPPKDPASVKRDPIRVTWGKDDEEKPEDKSSLENIVQQNERLMKQIEEQGKLISDMNTERQLAKRDVLLAEKLAVLEELSPELAIKYKDEKDIGKLDILIDTAKSFKDDFPELRQKDEGEEQKAAKLNMINPIKKPGEPDEVI